MPDSTDKEVARRLDRLGSLPPADRAAYLLDVGWSRAGQPTPLLDKFLDDPEPMVRIAAAQACWQTAADPSTLASVVRILANGLSESNDELALMAGTALTNIGESAVPHLIQYFAADNYRNPLVVRVIGEIGGSDAMRFLEEAASSSDKRVAGEAKDAVAALKEEDSA